MGSEQRSRRSRLNAEVALVRFALAAGEHWQDFVIIGGLNPDFLVSQPPAPHLGTTDVDLLLEVGVIYDRDEQDFGWLDDALQADAWRPRGASAWQWELSTDEAVVRLDLLCDVPDPAGQPLILPGVRSVSAMNLTGPDAALHQPVPRRIQVPDDVRAAHPGAPEHVMLQFASLGGYLVAKSAALLGRQLPKDAYDLIYVTLYNDAGAAGAATAVTQMAARPRGSDPRDVVRSAISLYIDPNGTCADHFAQQMRLAGDDESEERLRRDAAEGAKMFLSQLDAVRPRDA